MSRAGALSDAKVRKYCINVNRDENNSSFRDFQIATKRSGKRAFRKALAERVFGPGVMVSEDMNRAIYQMALQALGEEVEMAEGVVEEETTPPATPIRVPPATPETRDLYSTSLPSRFVRLGPKQLGSKSKLTYSDLVSAWFDVRFANDNVADLPVDARPWGPIGKSMMRHMLRLIYEAIDDDAELEETNHPLL